MHVLEEGGLLEEFCVHSITSWGVLRVSSQQLRDGGNVVAGCYISCIMADCILWRASPWAVEVVGVQKIPRPKRFSPS